MKTARAKRVRRYVIPAHATVGGSPVVVEYIPTGVRGLIVTKSAGGFDTWGITHKRSGFLIKEGIDTPSNAIAIAKELGKLPIRWASDLRKVFEDAIRMSDDDVRTFTGILPGATKDCEGWRKACREKLDDPTFPRCGR